MGFFVRGVTRRNLFAIVVGTVLAGVPFIAFNLWLDNLIERQGQSEVSTAARRAIALAEARVRDAIGTLDNLALAGVSSCDHHDLEAMRYAAFNTIPVKEIAVIGPDGNNPVLAAKVSVANDAVTQCRAKFTCTFADGDETCTPK